MLPSFGCSMPHLLRSSVAPACLTLFAGCALRQPTVARAHEMAFGMGGVGRTTTRAEGPEEPRYGAGAAFVWRAAYAYCLDKGQLSLCYEIPVDGIPASAISSPNPATPRRYSMLAVTPGVRLESDTLPGGWLPINFISIGFGAARYVSSDITLDGSRTARVRATTSAVRAGVGLNVRLSGRFWLCAGAFGQGGEEPEWFQRLGGVLPPGETTRAGRFGGIAMFSIRQ